MSDEPKSRARSWIGGGLFALLVLYPLSAGPAARLCDEINPNPCALPAHRFYTVYGHLFEIAEATGTREALWQYVEWFRDPRRRLY
jgi:hypothetical protein